MPGQIASVDAKKPAVRILVSGEVPTEMLHYICWGLEEEGVPASWERTPEEMTAVALSKRAACQSRLHVGIGVSGGLREAVLHHRDLPDEKQLLKAAIGPAAREELVRLGKNAARLVKGNPFCFGSANTASDYGLNMDLPYSPEVVEQIVSGVLEALRNSLPKRKA